MLRAGPQGRDRLDEILPAWYVPLGYVRTPPVRQGYDAARRTPPKMRMRRYTHHTPPVETEPATWSISWVGCELPQSELPPQEMRDTWPAGDVRATRASAITQRRHVEGRLTDHVVVPCPTDTDRRAVLYDRMASHPHGSSVTVVADGDPDEALVGVRLLRGIATQGGVLARVTALDSQPLTPVEQVMAGAAVHAWALWWREATGQPADRFWEEPRALRKQAPPWPELLEITGPERITYQLHDVTPVMWRMGSRRD